MLTILDLNHRIFAGGRYMDILKSVLTALENHTGEWISGGKLADQFDVSRNTIWRAMNNLIAAGYPIESVSGRGYRLSSGKDVLSETGIKLNLKRPDLMNLTVVASLIRPTAFSRSCNATRPQRYRHCGRQPAKGTRRFGRTFTHRPARYLFCFI